MTHRIIARLATASLVTAGLVTAGLVMAAPTRAFAADSAGDLAAAVDAPTPTSLPPLAVEPHDDPPQPPQMSTTQPRGGGGIAGTPDGNSVVLYGGGGILDTSTTPLADTWVWDGAHWTPRCGTTTPGADAPCAPGPRGLPATGTGPTGVVLYGGQTSGAPTPDLGADTYVWDGSNWNLVCSTCAPGKRYGSAAAGNGQDVLLFGGLTDLIAGGVVNDTWRFDGAAWGQLDPGGAGRPAPRFAASMAWDGRHYVLFGGADLSGGSPTALGDAWIWTDAGWVQACGTPLAACGPNPRFLAGFAYLANPDPSRRGALLGGGIDITALGGSLFGDLWFWNGSQFVKQASPWPDVTAFSGGPPPAGSVALGVLGSRAAACQVTIVATAILSVDPDVALGTRTGTIGFDADADGHPDPCPVSAAAQPVAAAAAGSGLPVTGSELRRDTVTGSALLLLGLSLVAAGRTRARRRLASLR